MRPSFAHPRNLLLAAFVTVLATACASLPPPTGELAAAEQSVARASQADADQYARAEISAARDALAQAQAAMSARREDDARRLALAAAADADLAHARSLAAAAEAVHTQRAGEVAALQRQLQVDADAAAAPPPPTDAVGNHAARLQALAADPRLAGLAELERARAREAVDALAQAKGKQRAAAETLAEQRVRAAEFAAYAQALRRDNDRLERTYTELQLEATRREAAAARAEAERLRMEAQMRAEEAERLRQQAASEELARQQAEQALQGAATQQAARLSAAREKELSLAREEAELVAAAKLPPMKRDARGEVFTLAGDAFASGQSTLTPGAAASLKALAHYLDVSRAAAVRIEGFTDAQGDAAANEALSRRRADAVRQALVAGGAKGIRIDVAGRGSAQPVADNATAAGRARNRRVEILVTQK